MNTPVLKFDATGHGHCLYTEAIDLSSLGALEIVQASTIEFNNGSQQWEVRSAQGNVLFADGSRQTCLDWEQQYFHR